MKKINVFLSSTFKDMNDERTYLAINVFPSIRRKCIQEGIDFSWIDLRWGITDEDAEKGLVVPKCLKSIDDCKPYFIGIIGNYYGTSVLAEDIDKLDLSEDEKAKLLNYVDNPDEGISITEIEIIHGVLNNGNARAAFFFKDVQELNDNRVNRLKSKIRNSGFPCHSYKDIEDLGEKVKTQMEIFLPSKEVGYLPLEKETVVQQCILQSYLQDFHCSEEYIELDRKFNWITNDDPWYSSPRNDIRTHIITGDWGVGKSSHIAHWINKMKNEGNNVVFYFINSLSSFKTPSEISEYFVSEILKIKDYKGIKIDEKDEPIHRLVSLMHSISTSQRPLTIVLDGIENLNGNSDSTKEEKRFYWLDGSPHPFILTVYSGYKEDYAIKQLQQRFPDSELQTILGLETQALEKFAYSMLDRYHKSMDDTYFKKVKSSQVLTNPLLLRRFLELLISCDTHESLFETIDLFTSATSIPEFIGFYYRHISKFFGRDIDGQKIDALSKILTYLYLSKDGLTREEIRVLLLKNGLEDVCIGSILTLLDDFIFPNGEFRNVGIIEFRNAYAKEAVTTYIKEVDVKMERVRISNALFEELHYPDYIIDKVHIFSEILHQLYSICDMEVLHKMLTGAGVVFFATDSTSFVKYWSCLYDNGYSMVDYLDESKITALSFKDKIIYYCKVMDLAKLVGNGNDSFRIAQLALEWYKKANGLVDCNGDILLDHELAKISVDFIIKFYELCNRYHIGVPSELYGNMSPLLSQLPHPISEYYRIKSRILYIDNTLVYIDDQNVINSFYSEYLEIKQLLYTGCCGHAKKELEVLLQSSLLRIGLKTNNRLIRVVIDRLYEDVYTERSAEDMISYDAARKRDVAILKTLQSYYANRNSFCPPEYYINSALKILREIEASGEMHVADDISNCYNRLLLLKS